jgi:hypothetical protein
VVPVAAALLVALLPGVVAAQLPPRIDAPPASPNAPSAPTGQSSPSGQAVPQVPGNGGTPPRVRDPFDPVWTSVQQAPFEGFPVFPSRLSGYGNYPLPGQLGGQPGGQAGGQPGQLPHAFPLLPLAAPEVPGWPAWARLRAKQPLPYAVDLALLVRHSDRVWWRAADGDAFVPLYFHDKLRTLHTGAEVQVRQAGEFELVLHASTRFVAQGPTDVQLGALTTTGVELDVRRFTHLRVQASGRDHIVRLPDGSQLQFGGSALEGEAEGPVLVLLHRADEPSRYGGRATIYNAGARSVRWRHAFGESRLAPGERVTMFLQRPAAAAGAGLVDEGGRVTADDRAVRFEGAEGAHLSWCGARFRVEAGGSVRLDPLQGEPFAAPKAAAGGAPGR